MSQHLVNEANRLMNDDVLNTAFDLARMSALEALARVDADDKTAVLRLQERVRAIEDIRTELQAMVLAVAANGAAPA